MRAITVAVEYSDILRETLPRMRHHFSEYIIVTSNTDLENVAPIAVANDAAVFSTDLFYDRGAVFNKWAALEWAISRMGRTGWLAMIDVDIVWPQDLCGWSAEKCCVPGILYGALRRMLNDPPVPFVMPLEKKWKDLPLHANQAEFAGFTQLVHASQDPRLTCSVPWHDVDWKTAGSADSFFQDKWPKELKVRLPWEVLHIGVSGKNWCGRVTPNINDGSVHPLARERAERVAQLWRDRRGKVGMERFSRERLS